MKRLSRRNLSHKPKQQTSWADNYIVNDEPLGDFGDRASALARAYFSQALHRLLGPRMQQVKRTRSHRRCEQCGKVIPKERLHAMPKATRCVSCQRSLEQRRQICISSIHSF